MEFVKQLHLASQLFETEKRILRGQDVDMSWRRPVYRVDISLLTVEYWDGLDYNVYAHWSDPARISSLRNKGLVRFNKGMLRENKPCGVP